MKICSVEDCDKPVNCKGWCKMHYRRWQRHGNPLTKLYGDAAGVICKFEGCNRGVTGIGFCEIHRKRFHKHGDPSIVLIESQKGRTCEYCSLPAISKGYCHTHYASVFKHGRSYLVLAADGCGHITKDGYRQYEINGVRKLEHVMVAQKALGKSLPKGAVVHHVNGNKLDNRPQNLVICPDQAYHVMLHTRMRQRGIKF